MRTFGWHRIFTAFVLITLQSLSRAHARTPMCPVMDSNSCKASAAAKGPYCKRPTLSDKNISVVPLSFPCCMDNDLSRINCGVLETHEADSMGKPTSTICYEGRLIPEILESNSKQCTGHRAAPLPMSTHSIR